MHQELSPVRTGGRGVSAPAAAKAIRNIDWAVHRGESTFPVAVHDPEPVAHGHTPAPGQVQRYKRLLMSRPSVQVAVPALHGVVEALHAPRRIEVHGYVRDTVKGPQSRARGPRVARPPNGGLELHVPQLQQDEVPLLVDGDVPLPAVAAVFDAERLGAGAALVPAEHAGAGLAARRPEARVDRVGGLRVAPGVRVLGAGRARRSESHGVELVSRIYGVVLEVVWYVGREEQGEAVDAAAVGGSGVRGLVPDHVSNLAGEPGEDIEGGGGHDEIYSVLLSFEGVGYGDLGAFPMVCLSDVDCRVLSFEGYRW